MTRCLLREGLARLLADAGVEVVATVGDRSRTVRHVDAVVPDVAIVDIKMPPTHTDEGIVAARPIREQHPSIGVLVLSIISSRGTRCDCSSGVPRTGRLPAQGPGLGHRGAGRQPCTASWTANA